MLIIGAMLPSRRTVEAWTQPNLFCPPPMNWIIT
jgi:hypothetical protein